ncbi:CAP domain [Dillenia turbinata]|uniref:CAP domain n=1 Tax=Dillenia turbinata TaxID=194707 RepID=A0AAN8V4G9_9MAGN
MANMQVLAFLCILGLTQVQFSQSHWTPEDFLVPHNDARGEVHVPPLVWNHTLEAYAKDYAKIRSQDCELVHSHGPYGENIFWGYGQGYEEPGTAVKMWIDEKEDYDYFTNSCAEGKSIVKENH